MLEWIKRAFGKVAEPPHNSENSPKFSMDEIRRAAIVSCDAYLTLVQKRLDAIKPQSKALFDAVEPDRLPQGAVRLHVEIFDDDPALMFRFLPI